MAQHSNFGLDFNLGETAEMIRNTVSVFAQAEIAPRAAQIDKSNEFPRDLWPRMGELGLHGITVEEEFGGLGLGYLDHAVAMEEVSRASASVALSYGAHSNLCINQIRRNGSDEQKRRWLPPLIKGTDRACFGVTEPNTGLNTLKLKTRAVRAHLRDLLVVAEIAVAFILLVGAGLLLRTFLNLQRTDPGLDAGNLLTAHVIVSGAREAISSTRKRVSSAWGGAGRRFASRAMASAAASAATCKRPIA